MDPDEQPPTPVVFLHGPDDPHTTFRIFSAHLTPAMREALRTTMHIQRTELDIPRSQTELVSALHELR